MSICFFIAIALGVLTDAAAARPVLASVAVVRDSRRTRRALRAAPVRFRRDADAPRPRFLPLSIRRILAPLTGAASPRAPAPHC
ncbi:MAG TPA: hypothetical protein VGF28_25395 [Thermoanaerobaculia bacterium]|jgi:hypothetical protein